MLQNSAGMASYMAECVPVRRWKLYNLRFLNSFFVFLVVNLAVVNISTFFEHAVLVSVIALVSALAVSAISYLDERYRSRHEWAFIVFWLALLIIAVSIAWHGIENHRHAMSINSMPTISHP